MALHKFKNLYDPQTEPIKLLKEMKTNENLMCFNKYYEPESNRISIWSRLSHKKCHYLEVILPYDFDVTFFLPQLLELNYVDDEQKATTFIVVSSFDELTTEMKKSIINNLQFENLKIMDKKNIILGDFIFTKDNQEYRGLIDFIKGFANIILLPNTLLN
jgi:hypothetical protein